MPPLKLPKIRKPMLYALIAFLCAAVVSALILWNIESNRLYERRTQVHGMSSGYAWNLQQNINHLMSATYAQAALVQHGKGKVHGFADFAEHMLEYFPQGTVLVLAPNGVIRHVAPLEGNEQALGVNLLTNPSMSKEALLARDSGKLTLAGPFELVQGGQGIVGRLPIFLEEENSRSFWGFANVVARISSILEESKLDRLKTLGLNYELFRIDPNTQRKQIIDRSTDKPLVAPIRYTIALANGKWALDVAPVEGWDKRPVEVTAEICLALMFCVMFAYIAKLYTKTRFHERSLERLVQQRTAELMERENDLHRAQEVAKLGSWITDLGTGETRLSKQAKTIFQLNDDGEFSPHWILSNVHTDDRDAFHRCWHHVLQGENCEVEFRLPLSENSGEWKRLRAQIEQIRDSSGEITRRIGTIQDVTDLHRAEEDLRIAAIAFEAQEGMIVTDADNTILRVNQAFTSITGYSSDEAIGHPASMLKSGLHESKFYKRMWSCLRRHGTWQGEIWNRRKSGEVYPEWLQITAVKNRKGQTTNYVGTIIDVSQRKAAEAQIQRLAFYDPVTKLPNRRLFMDRLRHTLVTNARNQRIGVLMHLDLDNFKTLNDTLGHDQGDLLLQQVASRLSQCVRKGDTVSRFGGDEFVLMLEDMSDDMHQTALNAEIIACKILADLGQAYILSEHRHHVTASIGVTLFSRQSETAENLLKQVELAMYQAKQSGGNASRFFDPDMLAAVNARAGLEADLREGLRTRQFQLHYQIQVNENEEIFGAEALVRWRHPLRGMVSPADFIPLAEQSGLILPLGAWVLEAACEQLVEWENNPETEHLVLAVNVSARQFHQKNFVTQVLDVLNRTGANPQRLKLELTESLLIENVEHTIAKMSALKCHGVSFSLDDFGTGYSSLSYLKRLPLDQLKIDQSFVRGIPGDVHDETLVNTIITLGKSPGLAVIAEGVETEAQRDFLREHGCGAYQGYLYGRPNPRVQWPHPSIAV